MHINNCLFISALNSTPGTYEWINQKFGISGDEVAESHSYEIGYQTLMRTSLRNGSSTQPVKFIVGDKKIYLFDAPSKRLAVLDKANGSLLQQYQVEALSNPSDFTVDEANNKAYFLNSSLVYEVEIN